MANAAPDAAAIAARAAAAAQVFVDDPAHPVLSEEDAHHLARVLRLREGEVVIAADGRGHWVRTLWRGEATLEPLSDAAVQFEAPAEPPLTVVFAPVKGERPEWVVQKLTELGIDRIVPLLSERSVVRWSDARGQATVEKLRRVRARRRPRAAGSGCPSCATPCASPTLPRSASRARWCWPS